MRKILAFILIALTVGCSKQPETIYLACDGRETLEGSDKNGHFAPETTNVKRTFKIYRANKVIETGTQSFDNHSSTDMKTENKQVYVMSVDNQVDFFDKDVYTIQAGTTTREFGYVSVGETEIFGEQIRDSKTKYDDYRVTINRISGKFNETHLEKYELTSGAIFTTTSEGICRRVEKRI